MVRKNKEQRKKRGGACLLRYCVCYPVSLSLNTVFGEDDDHDDEDDNDDNNPIQDYHYCRRKITKALSNENRSPQ